MAILTNSKPAISRWTEDSHCRTLRSKPEFWEDSRGQIKIPAWRRLKATRESKAMKRLTSSAGGALHSRARVRRDSNTGSGLFFCFFLKSILAYRIRAYGEVMGEPLLGLKRGLTGSGLRAYCIVLYCIVLTYCIVLYLPPVLNPMSYDGAGLRTWSKCVRAEARGGGGEGILRWHRRAISAYTWCVTDCIVFAAPTEP